MADTIFQTTSPPLKAVDNGDGTYSIAVAVVNDTGDYSVFNKVLPPLRAVKLADSTYAIAAVVA